MAVRAKKLSKKTALSQTAQSWLAGKKSGFFQFKRDDELGALWRDYGDGDNMFWRREMMLPITREELEANEEAWLDSGESDEYGSCSYFIHLFYADDEKQALWDERGDKKRFNWRPGMRGPEPLPAG